MNHQELLADQYEQIRVLGEGSFGKVYLYKRIKQKPKTFILDLLRAKKHHKQQSSQYFALKKFNSPTDSQLGLDHTTLRELKYLISLDFPHIIKGRGVIYSKKQNKPSVYLVLDFMLQLHDTLRRVPEIRQNHINLKVIAYHTLLGLNFLHKNMILHRDLKPQNIFIGKNGVVVIADFGFSRQFGTPNKKLSINTCTIEYRAPEIFFGSAYYTQKADIWSYGCILAYLYTRQTLFPSNNNNQLETLKKIFYLCGTPNEQVWPGFSKFPSFARFEPAIKPKKITSELKISEDVGSIIEKCLQLDPNKRLSANQLLKDSFFSGLSGMTVDVANFYDQKLKYLLTGHN